MRGMYSRSLTTASASASGLTGLDQTVQDLSWGAWVRMEHTATGGSIFTHSDALNPVRNGIDVVLNAPRGRIVCNYSNAAGASGSTSASGTLVPGVWVHIGYTWGGGYFTWFENGVPTHSSSGGQVPTVAGTRWTMFGYNDLGTNVSLFDFQWFPALGLSVGNMRLLMDPRIQVPGCKLRVFRHWNQGVSATIVDESGSGNNLTASSTLTNCMTTDVPPWQDYVGVSRPVGQTRGMSHLATLGLSGLTGSIPMA